MPLRPPFPLPRLCGAALAMLLLAEPPASAQWTPLKADPTRELETLDLRKTVYATRPLHDLETLDGWSAGGVGRIELTRERDPEGETALRFHAANRDDERIRSDPGGRMMGSATATLSFDSPQDWTDFNRLVFRLFVHPSGAPVHSVYLRFTCLDTPPAILTPHYEHVVQGLVPGVWNTVVWEFAHLRRDRVTEFSIQKLATGQGGVLEGEEVYDLDGLELQRVDADVFEGWQPGPGVAAFSQVGYHPALAKMVYLGEGGVGPFRVRDAATGQLVLSNTSEPVRTAKGAFAALDLTALRQPGAYVLEREGEEGRPFIIADSLWISPVRKALNFFRAQRCGLEVPGIHPACHKDVQGEYGDTRTFIDGGWHDAGDLSQGSFRTAHAAYALLEIAQALRQRNQDPALETALLEEARWGLDWLLKTRFGDGFRITWSSVGIYTDGIVGTPDDIVKSVQNNPWENFIAAGAEALGATVLRAREPRFSNELLEAARRDWQAAVDREPGWLDSGRVVLTGDGVVDDLTPFSHRWFSGGTYLTLGSGILASIRLLEATGETRYAEKAVAYGRRLLQCQERRFVDGIPLTGYFYTGPANLAIVNHRHAAFEETPLLALAALVDVFPDHPDWMEWYAGLVLHSEYLLARGSEYTAPYRMVPNAVFRRSDIEAVPDPDLRAAMERQFEDGTPIGEGFVLRSFPIWTTPTHHGNTAAQLSQSLALLAAAQARRQVRLEQLAVRQLEWVFGLNPFGQSLMYGEGTRFPKLYGYNQGDVVGAMPVGMDCLAGDRPFWPRSNHSTFKEVWVVPVSRFLWNAAYVGFPGLLEGRLEGKAVSDIRLVNRETGFETRHPVDELGGFTAAVGPGRYRVRAGNAEWSLAMVSGAHVELMLPMEHPISVELSAVDTSRPEEVEIEAVVRGSGAHTLQLRLFNARVDEPVRAIRLEKGGRHRVVWRLRVTDRQTPWVAVVVPDGNPALREELTGVAGEDR